MEYVYGSMKKDTDEFNPSNVAQSTGSVLENLVLYEAMAKLISQPSAVLISLSDSYYKWLVFLEQMVDEYYAKAIKYEQSNAETTNDNRRGELLDQKNVDNVTMIV